MTNRSRKRRALSAVAAAALLALVATACGSDDDGGSADTTAAAAETTAAGAETTAAGAATTAGGAETTAAAGAGPATGSEIKIGMVLGETGSTGSTHKYSRPVAEAWTEWVNEEMGGVGGHKVTLVSRDSKSEAATGTAAVQDLVENEKVIALLVADAAAEAAYAPYTQEQNIAVLGVGYNPTVWSVVPNWFTTATTSPAVVQEQFVAAKAVGATSFGAIACTEVPSCAASAPLYEPTADALGLGFAGLLTAASNAPSYTAECLQFIQSGADYIQFSIGPAAGIKIASDCRAQGYEGWFGASAGSVVESAFTDPELRMAGGLNGFPWFVDAAPVDQFNEVMEKYNPDSEYNDPTSTGVWAALELFRKAMTDAPAEPTREDVFTGYYSLDNEDLEGLLPQGMTYTEGQPAPKVDCFWVYKLEDGEYTSVEVPGGSGNSVTSGPLKSTCFPPKA